jgi:hypothetical protein
MSSTRTAPTRWLTRRAQARRWGVTLHTIELWGRNESLGLPLEFEVDGHFFRSEAAIERWERKRLANSVIRNLIQETTITGTT